MKKNSKNEWIFFNREYVPIGWNSDANKLDLNQDESYANLPLYTKYKGLSETTLIKLAWHKENGIRRNKDNEIDTVFFYNDGTNPQSVSKYWDDYFLKIKLLSKCEVKY